MIKKKKKYVKIDNNGLQNVRTINNHKEIRITFNMIVQILLVFC